MLDGLAEPPTRQDRQTVALFGELVLPCRVIVDDLNRHIDHGPSVFQVRSTARGPARAIRPTCHLQRGCADHHGMGDFPVLQWVELIA